MKFREESSPEEKSDSIPALFRTEDDRTQTIDLSTLVAPELSAQNCFDFRKLSNASFGKLLQALSVPTLLVARSHEIMFANSAFLDLVRGGPNLVDATFSSLFPSPREAKQGQLLLEKVFTDRKPEVREINLQIHSTRIWARLHLRTLRLGAEQVVLAQIENLTAQKLLLATRKYRKLVKIFPIGIAEFAVRKGLACSLPIEAMLAAILDAKVADGNSEFAVTYGRKSIQEFVGVRMGMLLPLREKSRILYEQWIQGLFPIRSFESREKDSSGQFREFENTLIGNVSDRYLIGFWWLKRDVSEKKKNEKELLKAQKIESLGILAGGIAHDFNNLLTGILGNVSIAQALPPGEKLLERLEAAAKAAKRAQQLTRQLLTFSRGGAPIKKTTSILGLLQDAVTFALRGSNVVFDLRLPKDLWPIDMDEGQMSQAINNLIINAVQAMPGGGTVHIHGSNICVGQESLLPLQSGRYVKLSIQDEGIGIPVENLQKVFDPYFTTKQTGSGLGLATVYSIVKKHDGLISVQSEVGVGATFSLYLPASTKVRPPKPDGKISEQRSKGKILVMDDEELIRDLANELLVGNGYEVSVAEHGVEAFQIYKESKIAGEPFDVVIMDLTIPGGMGGLETLNRLREFDPDVCAVVSSGYSDDPAMAHFTKYGFAGVLPKPYDNGQICGMLETVLRNSRRK
jgi:two-component system cell cycle sensor histidine kinase/response regulator CckA